MKDLEAHRQDYEERGAVALGMSVDTAPSKKAWAEDMGIENTLLLADFWPHGEVAKKYGVFDEKRVFKQGPLPGPINFRGVRLGVRPDQAEERTAGKGKLSARGGQNAFYSEDQVVSAVGVYRAAGGITFVVRGRGLGPVRYAAPAAEGRDASAAAQGRRSPAAAEGAEAGGRKADQAGQSHAAAGLHFGIVRHGWSFVHWQANKQAE